MGFLSKINRIWSFIFSEYISASRGEGSHKKSTVSEFLYFPHKSRNLRGFIIKIAFFINVEVCLVLRTPVLDSKSLYLKVNRFHGRDG